MTLGARVGEVQVAHFQAAADGFTLDGAAIDFHVFVNCSKVNKLTATPFWMVELTSGSWRIGLGNRPANVM